MSRRWRLLTPLYAVLGEPCQAPQHCIATVDQSWVSGDAQALRNFLRARCAGSGAPPRGIICICRTIIITVLQYDHRVWHKTSCQRTRHVSEITLIQIQVKHAGTPTRLGSDDYRYLLAAGPARDRRSRRVTTATAAMLHTGEATPTKTARKNSACCWCRCQMPTCCECRPACRRLVGVGSS